MLFLTIVYYMLCVRANFSVSSGDSTLIGIEDNPEFYNNGRGNQGYSNWQSTDAHAKHHDFNDDRKQVDQNVDAKSNAMDKKPVKRLAPPAPRENERFNNDDFDSNFTFGDTTLTAL